MKTPLIRFLVFACSATAFHAALGQTWNVNSNGNWGSASNWSPGSVPNAIDATATLGSIITANRTVTVNTTFTIGTLNINDNNNYTVRNNTLIFDVSSGSAALNVSGSGSPTISSVLSMSDNLVVTQSGTGTLLVSGAVATGGKTLTLTGSGNKQFSGVISGTGGVTVQSGTARLVGNNTFSGGLTLSGGTLEIDNNSAAGSGTLALNGGTIRSIGGQSLSNSVTVGGNFTVGGTGAFTLSGPMSLGASTRTITVSNSAATTFSGAISGTGGLTKDGTGTLTFSGSSANTYSGTTTVDQGNLDLSMTAGVDAIAGNLTINSGTVNVRANEQIQDTSLVTIGATGTLAYIGNNRQETIGGLSGVAGAQISTTNNSSLQIGSGAGSTNATFAGVIAGNVSVVKDGTSTQGFTGLNTYAGSTAINGGVLEVNTLANGGTASSIGSSSNSAGNLTIDGGTLRYTGSGSSTNRLFTIGTSGATIESSGTGTVTFSNTGSLSLAGTNTARTLTLGGTNTGTNTLASVIANNGSGATAVTKTGAGTWALTGSNTYTGVTSVLGGVLEVGTLANGGAASNIGQSSNAAANLVINGGTLRYTGAGVSSNRQFTLGTSGGTIDASGTGALNLTSTSAVALSGTNTARTFTLTGTSTGSNTLAASIGDNGSGATSLVKNGAGTWVLGGTSGNTYTGMTTVDAGELQLNKSSGNAVAGNVTVGDGSGTDVLRLTASNQIGDSSVVTINSSGQFLVSGSPTDTIGSLNMTGGLVNTGTGSLTLSADPAIISNAYSSSATIAGNISLQGSKTIQVADGSAAIDLDITANVLDMWYTSITKTGAGTLRLSGNNTFQGPMTISQGVVVAASNTALGTSTWGNSVSSGAALHLTSGITVNEGNLAINGTGTDGNGALQALSGANTFTGTLTASTAATVGASSGASLSFTGTIDLSADLTFAGAGNFDASGPVYGSSVLTKTGTGTLQFSGTSYDISGKRLDVLEGTVELNRAGRQINMNEGPTVGTTSGPAATLKLLTNDQIRNDLFVDIKESGTFDLNNHNEGLAGLRLYGGTVQTGTGTLTITNSGGDEIHSYASTQTATISGKLASNLAQGVNIAVDDGTPSTDLNVSAAVSGSATNWTKKGAGTLEFSGSSANTYTGQTIVDSGTLRLNKTSGVDAISGSSITVNSGGTLLLGNSNQIKNTTNLTLDGGTFSTGATVGYAEQLGALTLSSNSSINLGTGIYLLQFANSSAFSWTGTLTIYGWSGTMGSPGTAGRIFFGSNASGLTSSQLAQISFNGFSGGAILLSNGELVPVVIPEPGVVFAALLVAGLVGWKERRRLFQICSRVVA